MRQLVSTALVACVVSLLTVTVAGALAQEPAQPPPDGAIVTAGLNADTVDGRHAVKATNEKAKRRGKLVATDSGGYLPSNIVKPKWGLISEKPAPFADGINGWNEVQGIPAPFADGVDDVGITGLRVGQYGVPRTVPAGASGVVIQVLCPAGAKAVAGGWLGLLPSTHVDSSASFDQSAGWEVEVTTAAGAGPDEMWIYAICISTEPGSALSGRRTKATRTGN